MLSHFLSCGTMQHHKSFWLLVALKLQHLSARVGKVAVGVLQVLASQCRVQFQLFRTVQGCKPKWGHPEKVSGGTQSEYEIRGPYAPEIHPMYSPDSLLETLRVSPLPCQQSRYQEGKGRPLEASTFASRTLRWANAC